MLILDIPEGSAEAILSQMAALLVAEFAEHGDAWHTIEEARHDIDTIQESGFVRVAFSDSGAVMGWIGGLPEYDGKVWELHPLVVAREYQRQGIGRALVADFEQQVKNRGGLTVQLGSDDEDGRTSLTNADLYHNLWEQIAQIQNLKEHPYEFYLKCGYAIVGVIPDANGRGKPDILMAKRID